VLGSGRVDAYATDANLVAHVHLAHVREVAEEAAGADRDDHCDVGAELTERRPVEVVVVDVREQDGVHAGETRCLQRDPTAQVTDPGPQDGIRQQTGAVELNEDRGVPDVEQPGGVSPYLTPASSGPYAVSAAITSTSSAMIRTAQTGWYGMKKKFPIALSAASVIPTTRAHVAPLKIP
jgi:hypothetical protein